jgi:hypothetical protein
VILFDEKTRSYDGPSKNLTSNYDYINDSSRNDVSALRITLNQWFSRYPTEGQAELKSRLIRGETFDDAFFEMYLHELFLCMGFHLKLHPEMNGSTNHPDFYGISHKIEIYLEAKVDYNTSKEERSRKRIRDSILDKINDVSDGQYGIILKELDLLTVKQPSIREFISHLERHFKTLNYQEVRDKTKESLMDLHEHIYQDVGLRVVYSVIAYSNCSDKNNVRTIGIDASNKTRWINCSDSLIKSFGKKAKRYGEICKPYIICINALDLFVDEYDVFNAAFGRQKTTYYLNKLTSETIEGATYRENNGFFSTTIKRNVQVSAVLILSLGVGTTGCPKYWFIHNPFASYPLDPAIFPLKSYAFSDNHLIEKREAKPINEVLGIPYKWT